MNLLKKIPTKFHTNLDRLETSGVSIKLYDDLTFFSVMVVFDFQLGIITVFTVITVYKIIRFKSAALQKFHNSKWKFKLKMESFNQRCSWQKICGKFF